MPGRAAGLDFTAHDMHAELLNHAVAADTDLALVEPGNADQSWLYRRIAECEPAGASGSPYAHMPLGNPVLMDAALIAKVRAWIEAGAADD